MTKKRDSIFLNNVVQLTGAAAADCPSHPLEVWCSNFQCSWHNGTHIDARSCLILLLQTLVMSIQFVEYSLSVFLWHIRVDTVFTIFELIAELIVLLLDLSTRRWVNFYERQQRQEQAQRAGRFLPSRKLILALSLYFCLFLFLLLGII